MRAALFATLPSLEEVRCLQPELDETERAKGPAGWTQVRAWCEQYAGTLDEVLDPDVGDPIDLLVIAIDVDIAVEAGIVDPPHRVGLYETTRLRTTITQWLTTEHVKTLPRAVVLSTPVRAIEAWIIGALFPRERTPESIQDPARWLLEKGKLRRSVLDDKVWKELHLYRDQFAPAVAKQIKRVRVRCAEAERTLHEAERVSGRRSASR